MYAIQYYLSLMITNLLYVHKLPKEIVVTEYITTEIPVEVEVVVKDPHGFIKQDMIRVNQLINRKPYKVGDSVESVAYRQGQLDLYRLIQEKLIDRRG